MELTSAAALLMVVLFAIISALAGVLYVLAERPKRTENIRDLLRRSRHSCVFLFEDEELLDATDRAKNLLKTSRSQNTDWRRFCEIMLPRFPTLSQDMALLAEHGSITVSAKSSTDTGEIHAEWWNGIARVTLLEDANAEASPQIDSHSINALNEELATLRLTAEASPNLVWQQTPDGEITWANSAYLKLAHQFAGTGDNTVQTWPPTRVFETISLAQDTPEGRVHRAAITMPGETDPHWYECYSTTIENGSLHFASDAQSVVRAETALRDFVQTLTKTFAHLPTGLAIFDRNRQLALFNPALTDLTGLQPMFLSLRPTLFSFLDKLREGQMIPEPKDYKSWRAQMIALEAAAVDGTFSETWTLPSGRTYRVTGRPHPDGAVGFLFEDISSEISLTRHFRSELETGQAVVDSLDEAIAVFAPNGMLTMSNSVYTDLWGVDPSSTLGEMGIADATRYWQDRCEPNAIWDQVRNFVDGANDRSPWRGDVRLLDGRLLPCRMTAIAGGATLVAFTPPEPNDDDAPLLVAETPPAEPLLKIEA